MKYLHNYQIVHLFLNLWSQHYFSNSSTLRTCAGGVKVRICICVCAKNGEGLRDEIREWPFIEMVLSFLPRVCFQLHRWSDAHTLSHSLCLLIFAFLALSRYWRFKSSRPPFFYLRSVSFDSTNTLFNSTSWHLVKSYSAIYGVLTILERFRETKEKKIYSII